MIYYNYKEDYLYNKYEKYRIFFDFCNSIKKIENCIFESLIINFNLYEDVENIKKIIIDLLLKEKKINYLKNIIYYYNKFNLFFIQKKHISELIKEIKDTDFLFWYIENYQKSNDNLLMISVEDYEILILNYKYSLNNIGFKLFTYKSKFLSKETIEFILDKIEINDLNYFFRFLYTYNVLINLPESFFISLINRGFFIDFIYTQIFFLNKKRKKKFSESFWLMFVEKIGSNKDLFFQMFFSQRSIKQYSQEFYTEISKYFSFDELVDYVFFDINNAINIKIIMKNKPFFRKGFLRACINKNKLVEFCFLIRYRILDQDILEEYLQKLEKPNADIDIILENINLFSFTEEQYIFLLGFLKANNYKITKKMIKYLL